MRQARWPALLCLLLATALTIFAAARSPGSAGTPAEPDPPQSLNGGSAHYEEAPAVQIISLSDL